MAVLSNSIEVCTSLGIRQGQSCTFGLVKERGLTKPSGQSVHNWHQGPSCQASLPHTCSISFPWLAYDCSLVWNVAALFPCHCGTVGLCDVEVWRVGRMISSPYSPLSLETRLPKKVLPMPLGLGEQDEVTLT